MSQDKATASEAKDVTPSIALMNQQLLGACDPVDLLNMVQQTVGAKYSPVSQNGVAARAAMNADIRDWYLQAFQAMTGKNIVDDATELAKLNNIFETALTRGSLQLAVQAEIIDEERAKEIHQSQMGGFNGGGNQFGNQFNGGGNQFGNQFNGGGNQFGGNQGGFNGFNGGNQGGFGGGNQFGNQGGFGGGNQFGNQGGFNGGNQGGGMFGSNGFNSL